MDLVRKKISSNPCNRGCPLKLESLRRTGERTCGRSRSLNSGGLSGGLMDTTAGRDIEPFVDANRAAEFLVITRRRLLEMARSGEIPAHAIGERRRKVWRFRLSEL